MKRLISRLILLVVCCSVLFSSPRACITDTSGSIYVRADGSVDPSTAPISSIDYVTYTFNGNINDSIVVERSNIIIDGNGYTLRGSGLGKGFDLSCVNNVTIKNTDISARRSGRDAHPNYGIYLFSSSFNTISGNNVTDNYFAGIYLNESSNNTISGNNITNNYHGIYLHYSSNNNISGNNIINSNFSLPFPPIQIRTNGIELAFSSGNSLGNNVMADSDFNFGLLGRTVSDFVNDVDVSNSVDGKPVYYWVSRRNVEVPLDAGYVALVNCTNVRIENLTLTKNMQGILLAYTNYTTIVGNNITNNWNGILLGCSSNCNDLFGNNVTANDGVDILFTMCSNNTVSGNNITNSNDFGIYLNESSNNTIVGNNIANNYYGIWLLSSYDNKFYHNNLMDNIQQAYFYDSGYSNVLDDGYPSGGNYWSDYNGVDMCFGVGQNEIGFDWIGDSPYIIDGNNSDRYPLMQPFVSEIEETHIAYRNLLLRFAETRSQLEAFNSTLAKLTDKIASTQSDLDSLNETVSIMSTDIRSLNVTIADLQQQTTNLNTNLSSMRSELQAQIGTLNTQILSLQGKLDSLNATLQTSTTTQQNNYNSLSNQLNNILNVTYALIATVAILAILVAHMIARKPTQ